MPPTLCEFSLQRTLPGPLPLYGAEGRPGLFELLPLEEAQIFPELATSSAFIDYCELRKLEGGFLAVFAHEGCSLGSIRATNDALEETYLAVITKSVLDLALSLQDLGFGGLSFELRNFRVLPNGSLKAKNRFGLFKGNSDKADFEGFLKLLRELYRQEDFSDPNLCISSVFKDFLRLVENFSTNRELSGKQKFLRLRETRFVNCKNSQGILTDLIDDFGSISAKSISVPVAQNEELVESSASSVGHQDAKGAEFAIVVEEVFRKHIEAESKAKNLKIASMLESICKGLMELEYKSPGRGRKIIQKYLK